MKSASELIVAAEKSIVEVVQKELAALELATGLSVASIGLKDFNMQTYGQKSPKIVVLGVTITMGSNT